MATPTETARPAPAARATSAARAKATTAKPATARKTAPAGAAAAKASTKRAAKRPSASAGKAWSLAKSIRVCMFVTWDGERQRSRPLSAIVRKDEHAIYFLVDEADRKDDQVERFPIVTLAFADPGKNNYLSLTGSAEVLDDPALVKTLWSPWAKAWWDSPDDPAIRVIKVNPQDAELWEAPGGLFAKVAMLAAAAVGRRPDFGENTKMKL